MADLALVLFDMQDMNALSVADTFFAQKRAVKYQVQPLVKEILMLH